MSLYEDKLYQYEYLIYRAIDRFSMQEYKTELREIGKVALLVAHETFNNNISMSFPVYAYKTIINRFRSELKAICQYLNINLGLELYQNHQLEALIENELLQRIEELNLLDILNPLDQMIIKYHNRGYDETHIAKCLSIETNDIKQRIKNSINSIYQYLK